MPDNIISYWLEELKTYDLAQLHSKPGANSWSMGQLYMHLLINTRYFIGQARICVSNNTHSSENSSADAKAMFQAGEFPDAILEGPPENDHTPQPENREQLITAFLDLHKEFSEVQELVVKSTFNGKTRHPGLLYFNGMEWLKFADMHLRHHLRQKKRIDAFLKAKE